MGPYRWIGLQCPQAIHGKTCLFTKQGRGHFPFKFSSLKDKIVAVETAISLSNLNVLCTISHKVTRLWALLLAAMLKAGTIKQPRRSLRHFRIILGVFFLADAI